jgi:hypothetical protein
MKEMDDMRRRGGASGRKEGTERDWRGRGEATGMEKGCLPGW